MTMLDTGTTGAKRQTFKRASPRDLLRELLEKHPRKSEESIHQMFAETVLGDTTKTYLDSIIEYWFANNYRSLVRPIAMPSPDTVRAAADRLVQVKRTIKARAVEMVLLDIVLPTGKALRDSTFAECAKAGGWFSAIAKRGAPSKIVGKTMSEAQVHKVWEAAA